MKWILFLVLAAVPRIAAAQESPLETQSQTADVATPAVGTEDSVFTSPLKELEWMVGSWIDRGDEVTVTTRCNWSHEGQFLSRSFEMAAQGEATLKGTQIIGWDPIEGQLRSWTFDSAGGFGTGRWFRDGNRWLVKTSFVLASGERASAINVITYVDDNTLLWQSTNREIAGELQPNIPEVTVVRLTSDEAAAQPNTQEGESKR